MDKRLHQFSYFYARIPVNQYYLQVKIKIRKSIVGILIFLKNIIHFVQNVSFTIFIPHLHQNHVSYFYK